MNRRHFLKNSALALFGFSVLPPATTYERIWRAQRKAFAIVVTGKLLDEFYFRVRHLYAKCGSPPQFAAYATRNEQAEIIDSDMESTLAACEKVFSSYKCVDGVWRKVVDSPLLQA